jgi:hypothetical protein
MLSACVQLGFHVPRQHRLEVLETGCVRERGVEPSEIRMRLDAVGFRCFDQRVQIGTGGGPGLRVAEQPVLPSDYKRANGVLAAIVVAGMRAVESISLQDPCRSENRSVRVHRRFLQSASLAFVIGHWAISHPSTSRGGMQHRPSDIETDNRPRKRGKSRPSEAEPFWTGFLRSLTRRGLRGVKLVISDSHEGLKAAASKVLKATWQRCRVHVIRNALAHAGKGQRQMVLAMINTVFAQESQEAAIAQWRVVADQLRAKFPKLADLLDRAEQDVLAFMSFPKAHRTQIHSTDPLERLNAEIKRRTDVVGIFPPVSK